MMNFYFAELMNGEIHQKKLYPEAGECEFLFFNHHIVQNNPFGYWENKKKKKSKRKRDKFFDF